jgi:hypothetical protein
MDEGSMSVGGRAPQTADDARPHPDVQYEALDLNRLVVFTLGWLRDAGLPPTFENIAVGAFRLFPSKFELRGYDHPDSNRVNRALLQLGPKYRNWAVGSTGTGYSLTPLGEKVLVETRQRLESTTPGRSKKSSSAGYTWDPLTDILDLKASEAFGRFREGGSGQVTVDDVWNALGAFRYTPKEAIRDRIIALRSIATEARDDDALAFLDALRKRFEGKAR